MKNFLVLFFSLNCVLLINFLAKFRVNLTKVWTFFFFLLAPELKFYGFFEKKLQFLRRHTFFFSCIFASSRFHCPPSYWPTTPNLVYLSFSEHFPYRWDWNDSHAHMHTSKEEERYLKALGGGWVSLSLTNPHLTSFPSSQCPFNVCSFFYEISCFTCLFMLQHSCFHTLGYTQVKPSLGSHGSCFVCVTVFVCEGGRYEGYFLGANS